MTSFRTLISIAALAATTLTTSVWAASDVKSETPPAAQTTAEPTAPATTGSPGMGMRAGAHAQAHAEQMKAMQEMHDKMMAAKTPEERKALMAERMTLMQKGMQMMHGKGGMHHMGSGSKMDKTGDDGARHAMMEQRMEMMQSMMQAMMDHMQSIPATK